MWRIILTEQARRSLISYFAAYQKYFLDRFSDTGIWSEDVIRKWYEKDTEDLLDLSLETIEEHFQKEILPYSELDNQRYAVFLMKDRFLWITFIEDTNTKTRTIRYLRIWRKK